MEFRLLGTVAVETYTGPLPLGPAKRRSLLAALLLSANTPVSVGRLTDSLWDDTPPSQARGVIQGHVSRLRALLVGATRRPTGSSWPPSVTPMCSGRPRHWWTRSGSRNC